MVRNPILSLLLLAATGTAAPADTLSRRGPTPTTLQTGQLWIRAVAAPNYHKYLQTKPVNEPGVAIMDSSRTAGQFNIVDGQLVEATGGEPLYMHVEKPADLTQRKLSTWFNTTKNDFGTFVFSGDAVTWSTPEIKRQNLAAWLVCQKQALFINTGAYSYQTPAGCADQTVSIPVIWWLRVYTNFVSRFISTMALPPMIEVSRSSFGGTGQRE